MICMDSCARYSAQRHCPITVCALPMLLILVLGIISQKSLGLWDLGDLNEATLILADDSRGTV